MPESACGDAPANAAAIPLFSTCQRMEEIILGLAGEFVERTSSWSEFQERALCSRVALIAIDCTQIERYADRLEHLTRSSESTRFVLLIEDQAAEDDLLGRMAVARVIRLSQATQKLRAALLGQSAYTDLGWVVARLSTADVTPIIRRVVRIACIGPLPVPSVNKLAEIVHCSRRTLSRQWLRSRARGSTLELRELLAWIALLRALALRSDYRKVEDLIAPVGSSRSALYRSARRLLSVPLGEIKGEQARQVFMEEVLDPLLSR